MAPIDQRGQGSVELALLAPIMLVLLFLIFEFGRVFGSWLLITNSAREGARYAITQNCDSTASDPAIKNRVKETAKFLVVNEVACTGSYDSCIQVTRCPLNGPCPAGTPAFEKLVYVVARYRVYTLMPITGNIPIIGPINYPGFLEVVGFSTMRCE